MPARREARFLRSPEFFSHRDFSGDVGVHESNDFVVSVVMSEEEHQFCQHAFHGAVVAVHHPRLEELESRSITERSAPT